MRVRITTFKPTGKWYNTTVVSLDNEWNQMIEQVRRLIADKHIPGLEAGGSQDFIVLVQPIDGESQVPRLLNLDGGIEKQTKYVVEPTPIQPCANPICGIDKGCTCQDTGLALPVGQRGVPTEGNC